MSKREYKLAADPIKPGGPLTWRREILEITEDGHRQVILVVANDDAMDVRDALARVYQDGREDRASEDVFGAGARVRLINPPGTKVPYGAIGVAEEAPGSGGLFWAQFPQGRMHTRVSEVEVLRESRVDESTGGA